MSANRPGRPGFATAGLDLASVIPIRDEIRARVEQLMASLGITARA
jgi:hypothetical protein